jgi:hypothetical protein
VSFTAQDTNGHLRGYSLTTLFGHNQATPVPPGGADGYSTHIDATRHWNGGVFTAVYEGGTTFRPSVMPACAYEFRLRASKRTTNGYGLIYDGLEDTKHLTLQR